MKKILIFIVLVCACFSLASCSLFKNIFGTNTSPSSTIKTSNVQSSTNSTTPTTNSNNVIVNLGGRTYYSNGIEFETTFFNNSGKTIYYLINLNIKIYVNGTLRADAYFETINTGELKNANIKTVNLTFPYDSLYDTNWWLNNKGNISMTYNYSYDIVYTSTITPSSSTVPSTTSTTTSTRTSTSTTTSSSKEEELTATISKTLFEYTYGKTLTEIKNDIKSYINTNGSVSFPTNMSTQCGTQNITLTFQKGSQTKTKSISITIKPNDKGFQAYASTATQDWYWEYSPSEFKFKVYFENNTGKAISSFNIVLAYGVDGNVRACGDFYNNKLDNNQNIKNGEKVTWTFTISRNTSYVTYSENTWISYFENQRNNLYQGYDYSYWQNINLNVDHNLHLIFVVEITYA